MRVLEDAAVDGPVRDAVVLVIEGSVDAHPAVPRAVEVRVLHSYYLADTPGTASGMVYEEYKDYLDVDTADGEGLMMKEVRSVVESGALCCQVPSH